MTRTINRRVHNMSPTKRNIKSYIIFRYRTKIFQGMCSSLDSSNN